MKGLIEFNRDFTVAFDKFLVNLSWMVRQDANRQRVISLSDKHIHLLQLKKGRNQRWHGRMRVPHMPMIELTALNQESLQPQTKAFWNLRKKWAKRLDNQPNNFHPFERTAFKEITENSLYQYILHGELKSIPYLPSRGALLMRSDLTIDFGIDLPSPIRWIVLENSDRELVLGMRNGYHLFGFLKKTVAQKWAGSLFIEGYEGMLDLMPLDWDKLAPQEKAFWKSRRQ